MMKRSKLKQELGSGNDLFVPFGQNSEALAQTGPSNRTLTARLADARPVRSITTWLRSRKSAIPLSVAVVFGAANLISYLLMPESSTIDDGFVYFGWPFYIYAKGGFFTHEVIIWTGLLGNVVLALCVTRLARRFLTKS
jgi:hypothetical protein